jgi:hypothetical protein
MQGNAHLGIHVIIMHHRARHLRTVHLRAMHGRVTYLRAMPDMVRHVSSMHVMVRYVMIMHIRIMLYHSITSLAGYTVPYNEYLVEISGSLACSRDYLYWFKLAVLGNI